MDEQIRGRIKTARSVIAGENMFTLLAWVDDESLTPGERRTLTAAIDKLNEVDGMLLRIIEPSTRPKAIGNRASGKTRRPPVRGGGQL